ncbi:MAG: replication initiation protein, partial [Campylobacter sp.]|nr:replication initiation protein [Campylobacter sp.]
IEFYFEFYHERHKSISETAEAFYKLADNLLSFKVKYSVENRHYAFICFEKLKLEYADDGEPIMKIKAQEDFFELITNLQLGFTQFELKEFIGIKGKYAKNLYRLLKQFRSTGFLKMEWQEFCKVMQIPTSYKMSHIDQKILKPCVAELSTEPNLFNSKTTIFKNLKYEKIKDKMGRGRGGKVIGIEFYFTAETRAEISETKQEQEPKEKPKKIAVTETIYFETEQEKREYLANRKRNA